MKKSYLLPHLCLSFCETKNNNFCPRRERLCRRHHPYTFMESRRNNKYARGVAKHLFEHVRDIREGRGVDLSRPFSCGIQGPASAANGAKDVNKEANDEFDREFAAYYINLDSASDRREYIDEDFAKTTGLSSILERQVAVVGKDIVIPPPEDKESELGKYFSNHGKCLERARLLTT